MGPGSVDHTEHKKAPQSSPPLQPLLSSLPPLDGPACCASPSTAGMGGQCPLKSVYTERLLRASTVLGANTEKTHDCPRFTDKETEPQNS